MRAEHDSNLPISIWLVGAVLGDDQAFEQLWAKYYPRLVQLARAHISGAPNRVVDEEDIAGSALTSFCIRAREGHYPELHDRHGLWKLLIAITHNKARAMARKESRRLQLLQEFSREPNAQSEPSPEFAAEMADQLRRLLTLLSDDDLMKHIAIAKLEAYTNDEIAEQVGMSTASIGRKLRLIRERWASAANE